MIWSGLMQNGKVNKIAEKFFKLSGNKELFDCVRLMDSPRKQENK
jgi:hypothetical protein